jgi:iron(III) transport system substrate-binding protein
MTRSRRAFRLAVTAVALVTAGLSSTVAVAQDASWAGGDANARAVMQLYAAAKEAKQSEVVVYGGYSAIFKPLWEVFSARFPGMAVVPNPLSGAALVSKLDAEAASGQYGADILMAGMTELLSNVAKDRAQAFRPPNLGALPQRYVDPQGRFVIQFADVFGVVYNTQKMTEADLPKSIKDLTDPKHKGMIMDNPLAGALIALCWIELYNSGKIDPPMMKALRDNATTVPSVTPYYANLTQGSVRMIPWGSFSRYLRLKEAGAPVGFRAVPGMVVPLYGGTAILKGAPNLKMAQLFQAWFVTPEAQMALVTKGYSYPLMPGVQTPPDWPKLQALVDALVPIAPADYMAVRAKFEDTVRKTLE